VWEKLSRGERPEIQNVPDKRNERDTQTTGKLTLVEGLTAGWGLSSAFDVRRDNNRKTLGKEFPKLRLEMSMVLFRKTTRSFTSGKFWLTRSYGFWGLRVFKDPDKSTFPDAAFVDLIFFEILARIIIFTVLMKFPILEVVYKLEQGIGLLIFFDLILALGAPRAWHNELKDKYM
jgi:hypothetical protein